MENDPRLGRIQARDTNKKKKLVICIILLVIIGLGIASYYVFFNKKEKPHYPNDDSRFRYSTFDGQKFSKYERINLTENNTEIIVNNKKINIKLIDNYIYIDDTNTNIYTDPENNLLNNDYSTPYVDITDYFIMTYRNSGDYDSYDKIIDENGKELILLNGGSLGNTYFFLEDGKLYGVDMVYDDAGKEYRPDILDQVKYDDGKIYFNSVAQPVEQRFHMLHYVPLGEKNITIRMMANLEPFRIRVKDGNKIYLNNKLLIEDTDLWFQKVYVTRDLIYVLGSNQCSISLKYAINKKGELIRLIDDEYIGIDDFTYEHNQLFANSIVMKFIDEITCNNEGKIEFIYDGQNIAIKKIKN